MPVIYSNREHIEAGGLISYGAHYPDLYRRAASYVDKIFKGAKPSDLPVEQPTKLEIVINVKAAKALGLNLPLTLLGRADEDRMMGHDIGYWHLADIAAYPSDVRFRGKSGDGGKVSPSPLLTHSGHWVPNRVG